jgi:pre-rRNA-processing protein TSR4
MVLLLQLNGELPEQFPGHERRLYVLTCRRKTCRRKEGSVRTLRGVRISEEGRKEKSRKTEEKKVEAQVQKPVANLGESLFGTKPIASSGSANPFSTSSNPFSSSSNPFSAPAPATSTPFASAGLGPTSELAAKPPQLPSSSPATNLPKTFATALSLNNDTPKFGPPPPPEPWPQEADLPPAYPLFYFVDTDYETLDKVEDLPIPTQTMDLDEGSGSGSQKEDKDVYESTIDKTFQKFADRLSQNPEQVIRYEFKGQPLLYSKKDLVGKMLSNSKESSNANVTVTTKGGIPRCGNCGAGRVFEVQLTPHVIMELESEENGLDGMEWGTIILGVCERDCMEKGVESGVGYVEEWAGVQWEELSERK